jgi:starch phosphorylase
LKADRGLISHKIPGRIAGLEELAYNLWWSWHGEARELFKILDRPLWKSSGHNPVRLLEQVPRYRLTAAAEDPSYRQKYDSVMADFQAELAGASGWYAAANPGLGKATIAYFSMEFAIHNSLPLYAGGLGVLAGDYCKEASDLGVPLVGVGFMYPQGYFEQRIPDDGWQREEYTCLDFAQAPVTPVQDEKGLTLKVRVELDSRAVWVAVWQVKVGRVKLYLLDTDLSENEEVDRHITARLYAGDAEARLQQEILLGIGGVRVLRALNCHPAVWHANEGHSVFMLLERCRELVQSGARFEDARARVESASVFTTHTPVAAGNDAFPHALIDKYFYRFWPALGISREQFLELGTLASAPDRYNMTVLGMRLAAHRNGVSQLHGAVCRRMWHEIWPELSENDVPILSITNGVHVPTWASPQVCRLLDRYLGKNWLEDHDNPAIWEQIDDIPDDTLWLMRRWLKHKLIAFVQNRARSRWCRDCGSPSQALAMGALLDPDVLTLGFSRRFTEYKRASLLFNDMERLRRLLHNNLRPIQIIFAGKAHPNDHNGKCIIQRIYNFARDPRFNGRIAFVEDYDMHLARYLVHGVDVWLNTPLPQQEASGTSGMKAAINGVPHLSILDGWWYEGYNGTNGWAIQNNSKIDGERDKCDAEECYRLLENEVIPLYYDQDACGVPAGWVNLIRQTMRFDTPLFSARRMLKDYVQQMYVPAFPPTGSAPAKPAAADRRADRRRSLAAANSGSRQSTL